MAKIAIDMEHNGLPRLADIYARKTEGFPRNIPAPGVGSTLTEVEKFLPDLEEKMIEFLAECPTFFLLQRLNSSR